MDPEDLEAQFTFTGADDESWFYVVLVAIEARGGPIICSALLAFELVAADKSLELTECLQKMAAQIHGLGDILPRMYERNDPHFFFNRIRPFLSGSKGVAGLPDGIFYEDGEGGGEYHQYIGPSAVQSSLLQFIDLALDVEHSPTGSRGRKDKHLESSLFLDNKSNDLLQVRRSRAWFLNPGIVSDVILANAAIHARRPPPIPRTHCLDRKYPWIRRRSCGERRVTSRLQSLPRRFGRFS